MFELHHLKEFMNTIKFLFLALFIVPSTFLSFDSLIAQNSSDQTLYLVRHAEKADDGTKDPDLTTTGVKRANKLATMLKGVNIDGIYSTDFKRTRHTAKPLADLLGLEIMLYDPKAPNTIDEIKSKSGKYLIVGHSNSTPSLVNAFLDEKKYEQLDESVYTKLFVMSRVKGFYGSSVIDF